MNKINAPHHLLDTSTGWHVFSREPDTVTSYGPDGKYQFKWNVDNADTQVNSWSSRQRIYLSIDGGQTWFTGNSIWSVYDNNVVGRYYNKETELNQSIIAAREIWKVARRKKNDRLRREAFKALSPEKKILDKAMRSEAWKLRKDRATERKAMKITNIVNQIFQIGPELIRLKENIEEALSLMSKGNIDRSFPYYHSRRRYINTANWTVKYFKNHIEAAQKRAENNQP
jgi:hypothetical protein